MYTLPCRYSILYDSQVFLILINLSIICCRYFFTFMGKL